MPDLLKTDINMTGMVGNPGNTLFSEPTNLPAKSLEDWFRVIDSYFTSYGKQVMAIKIASAYSRNLGFEKVKPDGLDTIYKRIVNGDEVEEADRRKLEDLLFWHVVDRANEYQLPIKVHTGYHARWGIKPDFMDLYKVRNNPSEAARLCTLSPETRFVFLHIGYPYYEEMIAVAKQFPNAYMDMAWAWILNPAVSTEFLKKYLLTAPANKIFTFGGDYNPVEPVLGHAVLARNGIARALSELVDEGYLSMDQAMKLTDTIMHENARKLYKLASV
jgi:predicted TIM-barrel fold metal-dependent hydrolase